MEVVNEQVILIVSSDEFSEYKTIGQMLGFKSVASALLVRSSFHAAEMLNKVMEGINVVF